jgi:trimethylamine--corrinoid protein Co-methyltransferase
MFINKMPRYDILSTDAMATLDKGWKRLLTEIGIEFMKPEALDLFRKAGQRVEDNTVFLDPEFVLEQIAKVPREFDMQARNHGHDVHIGGDHMVFSSVYGSPFVRAGETRREGTLADFQDFARLAQSFDAMDSVGGVVVELETGDVPALLEGHLAPDEASQSRAGLVLSRIETISRLG